MKKIALCAILAFGCIVTPFQYARIASHTQNILTNSVLAYVLVFSGTLFHELGHALTNSLFTGQPVDIEMGSFNRNRPPLLDLRYIKIYGFIPIGVALREDSAWNNSYKNIIRIANGPLAGMAFHYLVYKKINRSRTFLCWLNYVAFGGQAANFIPFNWTKANPSDGKRIIKNIKKIYSEWNRK